MTDDGQQFFDGSTEWFSKFEQSLSFMWLGMNMARDTTAQNLVLFLQKLDIPGKFTVCDGSAQSQQQVKNQGYSAIVVNLSFGAGCTLFVPRSGAARWPFSTGFRCRF
jgi:hypothetical protein